MGNKRQGQRRSHQDHDSQLYKSERDSQHHKSDRDGRHHEPNRDNRRHEYDRDSRSHREDKRHSQSQQYPKYDHHEYYTHDQEYQDRYSRNSQPRDQPPRSHSPRNPYDRNHSRERSHRYNEIEGAYSRNKSLNNPMLQEHRREAEGKGSRSSTVYQIHFNPTEQVYSTRRHDSAHHNAWTGKFNTPDLKERSRQPYGPLNLRMTELISGRLNSEDGSEEELVIVEDRIPQPYRIADLQTFARDPSPIVGEVRRGSNGSRSEAFVSNRPPASAEQMNATLDPQEDSRYQHNFGCHNEWRDIGIFPREKSSVRKSVSFDLPPPTASSSNRAEAARGQEQNPSRSHYRSPYVEEESERPAMLHNCSSQELRSPQHQEPNQARSLEDREPEQPQRRAELDNAAAAAEVLNIGRGTEPLSIVNNNTAGGYANIYIWHCNAPHSSRTWSSSRNRDMGTISDHRGFHPFFRYPGC